MVDENILKVFRAIAINDCSASNQKKILTHQQIISFAGFILRIDKTSNIFEIVDPGDRLTVHCYLQLLSQKGIGANVRSEIAYEILKILCSEVPCLTESNKAELIPKSTGIIS